MVHRWEEHGLGTGQAVNSRARNSTRTPLNNRQRRPGFSTIVETKFLPGQSGVNAVFLAGRRNRVNFRDCDPGSGTVDSYDRVESAWLYDPRATV